MSKSEAKIFSNDIAIISLIFISFSILYLILSLIDLNKKVKRYTNSYKNLKERYLGLLVESDIASILKNDREFNEDLNYIKSKRSWTTLLWILSFVILTIVVLFLTNWLSFEDIKCITKCF